MEIPATALGDLPVHSQAMIRYAHADVAFSSYFVAGRITTGNVPISYVGISVSMSSDPSIPTGSIVFVDVRGLCFGFEHEHANEMRRRRISALYAVDGRDHIPVFRMDIRDGRVYLSLAASVSRHTLVSLGSFLCRSGATASPDGQSWIFPSLQLPASVMRLLTDR